VARRLLREYSREEPRNDGIGDLATTGQGEVTRRLLRGDFQVSDLATTGWVTSQRREGDSGTEIASGGVSSE